LQLMRSQPLRRQPGWGLRCPYGGCWTFQSSWLVSFHIIGKKTFPSCTAPRARLKCWYKSEQAHNKWGYRMWPPQHNCPIRVLLPFHFTVRKGAVILIQESGENPILFICFSPWFESSTCWRLCLAVSSALCISLLHL
jgi:hypothetical protein